MSVAYGFNRARLNHIPGCINYMYNIQTRLYKIKINFYLKSFLNLAYTHNNQLV